MTDCMPLAPRHEPLLHRAARVVHNLFHPHHKVEAPVFLPAALSVCVTPELETVTVSAPAFTPPFGDDPDAPGVHSFNGGSLYVPAGGGYTSWLGGAQPHLVTCPELSDDGAAAGILFAVGLLAVVAARHRSR